jgi:hypothetical protein
MLLFLAVAAEITAEVTVTDTSMIVAVPIVVLEAGIVIISLFFLR